MICTVDAGGMAGDGTWGKKRGLVVAWVGGMYQLAGKAGLTLLF